MKRLLSKLDSHEGVAATACLGFATAVCAAYKFGLGEHVSRSAAFVAAQFFVPFDYSTFSTYEFAVLLMLFIVLVSLGVVLAISALRHGPVRNGCFAIVSLVVFSVFCVLFFCDPIRSDVRHHRPNKSLQPTPGSGSRSAARFTSLGPAWLSSDR